MLPPVSEIGQSVSQRRRLALQRLAPSDGGDPYKQHDSGLYVPEAISRRRHVLTRAEWKLYEKALGLFRASDLDVQMRCGAKRCDDRTIVKITPELAGREQQAILRCGCTDRVFTSAF